MVFQPRLFALCSEGKKASSSIIVITVHTQSPIKMLQHKCNPLSLPGTLPTHPGSYLYTVSGTCIVVCVCEVMVLCGERNAPGTGFCFGVETE